MVGADTVVRIGEAKYYEGGQAGCDAAIAAYKRRVMQSRLSTTKTVIALIDRLHVKPECLISGSAIGIYGVDVETPVKF